MKLKIKHSLSFILFRYCYENMIQLTSPGKVRRRGVIHISQLIIYSIIIFIVLFIILKY